MTYSVSVSAKYVQDESNRAKVLSRYKDDDKPTVAVLAKELGTSSQNVQYIVSQFLPVREYEAEKALRYSRSKMGEKNPMLGKSGSQHHNYKGMISTGDGYTQSKSNGRYERSHREVVAHALGLEKLPEEFVVHHIDENKLNNSLDNLALTTAAGHRKLHRGPEWKTSPLWNQWVSGTSRSKEIIPTPQADS